MFLIVKIKVNLAFPKVATTELSNKVDGVGLLRMEHMLTKDGIHPMEYIRQDKKEELKKIIKNNISIISKVFFPKPIWVRSLDIRTDEYRDIIGGEKEPIEANPSLGWHGIRRSLDQPEIIKIELLALKEMYEEGMTNIGFMIPFIHDVSELRKVKDIAKSVGLPIRIKIGIMVEVPSAAITIEDFCREGIDFVSFGSNDLTQTTLGVGRNNKRTLNLFNEMHSSMKFLFKHVIDICKKYDIETSICGELPSNKKDAVEFLINEGIDSISVNIDTIEKVKEWVIQ